MPDFPALPLWTDAYLADTTHLSEAEHGRYMLMLIHLWRAPKQRFPNDDEWLARKFGRTVEDIQKFYRPLIEEFFKCDGNWLRQKRIDREFSRLSAGSEKQSARAKSRWKNEKDLCRGIASAALPPKPYPDPDLKKEGTSIEVPKKESCASPSARPIPRDGTQDVSENSDETKKTRTKSVPPPPVRGCRLPETWQPTAGDLEYAAAQGCTPAETERIALDFQQYWRAKAGKDAVKCDWHATWQRWVRTDRDGTFKRSNGNGNGEENIREWLINQAIKGPFGPMAVHVDGTCSNSTQRDLDFTQGEGVSLLRGPGKSH